MAKILTCRLLIVLALLVTCAKVTFGASDGSTEPIATYHSNAAEVQIKFSVIDQNQHAVATLQAGDFAVVDEELVIRDFQSFRRVDWTNIEIAILVDASESAGPHRKKEILGLLQMLAQSEGVPEQNISIFSFQNQKPTLLCSADCRTSHAADRFMTAQAGGLTPLFDTIVFAVDGLAGKRELHTQKVLIVLSDGDDTVSRNSLADALDAAVAGEVEIYSVDLGDSSSSGAAVLHRLSTSTGGEYFSGSNGAMDAMNAILENSRASYTVTYRLPSHRSGFHLVRILPTHNLNLQFLARGGYYYPTRTE